jgi:hypothetical protein
LHYYLQGDKAYLAYQRCGHPNSTNKTASEQAARIMARAEVKARLGFLLREKSREATGAKVEERGDRRELVKRMWKIVRTSPSITDQIAAAKLIEALDAKQNEGKGQIVDPAAMAAYLRAAQEQGKTLEDLARGDDVQGRTEGGEVSKAGERADDPPESDDGAKDGFEAGSGGGGAQPVVGEGLKNETEIGQTSFC